MSNKPVEYLSFGGGPPSVALMILNAWGEITPKADLVVFADTGAEKGKTYELLNQYQNWPKKWDLSSLRRRRQMLLLTDETLSTP